MDINQESVEANFIDDFYELDIPVQNGFIYIVAPGNEGAYIYSNS